MPPLRRQAFKLRRMSADSSAIQALDRLDPVLPLSPQKPSAFHIHRIIV
jgi:hypothetical protein